MNSFPLVPTILLCISQLGITDMALQGKHMVVRGRVQGVGFRFFVQEIGIRLGLKGDVRNCWDSSVEIHVEGETKRIVEFVKEVEKGPPLSRVDKVEIQDVPISRKFRSFTIEGM